MRDSQERCCYSPCPVLGVQYTLLHPSEIRNWADATFSVVPLRRKLRPHSPFHVDLARDFSVSQMTRWRVLPVENQNRLYWYDPAGFLMGVSIKAVEAWEAGRNIPNGTAQRMLALLKEEPQLMLKVIVTA